MVKLGKRRSRFNFIPLVLLLLVVFIITFGLIRGFFSFKNSISKSREVPSSVALWESSDYSELLLVTDQFLAEDPFHGESLFFNGASSFYLALSMVSLEDKLDYLNRAIISLRKHMSVDDFLYEKESYYLLGKCYVHKGSFYSDLAVKYLLLAKNMGYENSDMREYLALAYSRMGDYENSLAFFETLAQENPTAAIYQKMGEDAFNSGNYELSRTMLLKAIELSQNEMLRLEALYKLGQLYFDIKNWVEAEKVLSQYLDIDYNNADVHFMLGEVYFYMDDIPSARAEWHRTERLDPRNRDALLRLYN